jgi:hypothetical protein
MKTKKMQTMVKITFKLRVEDTNGYVFFIIGIEILIS